jgi:hypothetical protein
MSPIYEHGSIISCCVQRTICKLIGSGEVVTSPRINEDGTAVEEYNNGEISGAGVSSPHQNGKNPKCVNVV